jgi:Mn-dependent DtxR family transcriptional regulator
VIEVKNLYEHYGTLQQVADALGITRERVRQLLEKGESYGLFKYETTRERNLTEALKKVSKEEFISCIKNGMNRFDICLKFNVDMNIYFKIVNYYQIDTQDYLLENRYKKYLIRYSNIVDELGHHPSTTEMQKGGRKDWRYTQKVIARLWGSMDKFRQEYGIEKPPFSFHENTIAAFQKSIKRRQALKQEKIEKIKNFIKIKKIVSFKMIINEFGYSPVSTSSYLAVLRKVNEIKMIRKSKSFYYLHKDSQE